MAGGGNGGGRAGGRRCGGGRAARAGIGVALALLAVLLGGVGLMLMPLSGNWRPGSRSWGADRSIAARAGGCGIRCAAAHAGDRAELSDCGSSGSVTWYGRTRDEVFREPAGAGRRREACFSCTARSIQWRRCRRRGMGPQPGRTVGSRGTYCERRRPRLALELGSGTSSIWIGYALQRHGGRWCRSTMIRTTRERTQTQLRRHGLTETVELRHAPLVPVTVGDTPTSGTTQSSSVT